MDFCSAIILCFFAWVPRPLFPLDTLCSFMLSAIVSRMLEKTVSHSVIASLATSESVVRVPVEYVGVFVSTISY
jgi:hypothetical protein